jgi:hypothetical protein
MEQSWETSAPDALTCSILKLTKASLLPNMVMVFCVGGKCLVRGCGVAAEVVSSRLRSRNQLNRGEAQDCRTSENMLTSSSEVLQLG